MTRTETAANKHNGEHVARAVERYMRAGFAPIPLPAGSKNPNRPGWQHERWGIEDVPRLWTNGQGVGLLLGDPSGHLVDVDLDCGEAVAVAGRFLPPTQTSGRPSAPHSHWWYRSEGLRTDTFKDITGETIVEARGDGRHTAVAPSIHPDGERYVWHGESGLEIAGVGADELIGAVRRLATAAVVARHLPPVGGRHDFALAVAGFLLRGSRLDEGAVLAILLAAWHAGGGASRDAIRDLEGIVRDTAENLARGVAVAGGGRLDEMVPGLPRVISRYWGWGSRREEQAGGHGPGPGGIVGDVTGEGTPPTRAPGERHALTDLGNADRFIERYGGRVLWCEGMRSYLVWDGKRWAKDDGGGGVVKLAQKVARGIHHEAADETDADAQRRISRWAMQSQNAARIGAMLAMARPHLTVSINALDSDPWLLNCQNGTLDLRTGGLRPHDPQDRITKIVPVTYDPAAEAPRFEKFLRETLVDDGVIGFVQRFAGYSLTGDTRERAMTILWGSGKNGKSTLVELLLALLGDYADSTDVETVLTKKHAGVGNDVAALKGHRFVSCSEVEKGRRLAESKVKQLTGRDTITARFLFCEPFSFRPEFKLWMSTNNKPEIVGVDDAIWDRIRLVPFTQRFNGKAEDPALPAKLRAELPGVLAWAARGCSEWQRDGLGEPDAVRAATAEYREEMDTLAAFVSERCVEHPQASVQATRLYEAYKAWCSTTGEEAEKQKRFGQRLSERGYTREKSSVYYWFGIGLAHNGPDHPDDQASTSGSDSQQAGAENAPNGPETPDLLDDGPNEKNGGFIGKTSNPAEESGPSGPFSTSKGLKNPREEMDREKGPNGPNGPDGPPVEGDEGTV